jgi:glutathione synthase/RimK-type ligase-like ATP-grasp enzyme
MDQTSCCILNGGLSAWAFASLAARLSQALWIDVSETPRTCNYLLSTEDAAVAHETDLFIQIPAMVVAADKRLLAEFFPLGGVPTPETHLLGSLDEAWRFAEQSDREWCIKFPTGCGAAGHRPLTAETTLPSDWPLPLVVQEFIRLDRPQVYRTYAAGGETFGWVVRRFPNGVSPSPWVAHARGARYESEGTAPREAEAAARAALKLTGLLQSFGCVDLIRRPSGEWLVLEVGTDGGANHVDRDLGLPDLEAEMDRRIAEAFWARLGEWRPWGTKGWHPMQS